MWVGWVGGWEALVSESAEITWRVGKILVLHDSCTAKHMMWSDGRAASL